DIRNDEDRNRLLQAVGKQGGVRPSILEISCTVYRGDAFLLCVDGFWDKVFEPEIEIELAKAGTAENWLHGMRNRVASRLRPGDDNYTALVVRASDPSLPPPPDRPSGGAAGGASRPGSKAIGGLAGGGLTAVLLALGMTAIRSPEPREMAALLSEA